MKIILDAMGGDNAPEAVVLGALDAVKDFNTEIILVGRGEEILAAMKKHGVSDLPAGIAIAHADDVVDMHDDPAAVLHKRKNSGVHSALAPQSQMMVLPPALLGKAGAMAARRMPLTRLTTSVAAVSRAPVEPAETKASP